VSWVSRRLLVSNTYTYTNPTGIDPLMRISTAQSIIADAEAEAVSILVVEDEAIIARRFEGSIGVDGVCGNDCVANRRASAACGTEQRPDLVLMDIRLRGPTTASRRRGDCRAARRPSRLRHFACGHGHVDPRRCNHPHGIRQAVPTCGSWRVGINIAMSHQPHRAFLARYADRLAKK